MSNEVKAKSWPVNFQLAYAVAGTPVIEHKVIAAANTVPKGAALVLSSGEVALAAANSGTLYGVAMADGAAGETIPVAVGDQHNVFIGQVDADASAVTFPFTCDIVKSGDNYLVDIGASVEDVLMVLGPVVGDDFSDTTDLPRVFFKILRSSYDGLVAAQA